MKNLLSINKKKPAIIRIINSISSNISLSMERDAPKKAQGTDPTRKGKTNLKFMFPDLIKFIEFPETTIMLQNKAIIGNI